MSSPSTSSPPSPPSETPGARGFDSAVADDAEPADVLQGWRRLLRVLGRDVPAANRVVDAATRKLARVR